MDVDGREFDVVVLGTGFTESLLAGALARVGRRVLHIDANAHYGAETATLTVAQLQDCLSPAPGEAVSPALHGAQVRSSRAFADRKAQWRHFCLDLCPRPVFSTGPFLQVLVGAGVTNYIDFKIVRRAFVAFAGGVHPVPSSKADVFQSAFSPLEKRRLGQFLQLCLPPDYLSPDVTAQQLKARRGGGLLSPQLQAAVDECGAASFEAFLESRKLSRGLRDMIAYGIAGLRGADAAKATGASAGAQEMMSYVASVGKYGPSPYIFPMFGASEFAQAFCRYSAINGGTYMLRQSAVAAEVDAPTRRVTALSLSGGERVRAHHVVAAPAALPPPLAAAARASSERARRGVYITAASIALPREEIADVAEGDPHALDDVCVTFAPACCGNGAAVTVLQLSSGMRAAPEGHYVVHLTAAGPTAAADMDAVAAFLFARGGRPSEAEEEEKGGEGSEGSAADGLPEVLWSCQFELDAPLTVAFDSSVASNVDVVSGVISSHHQRGMEQAVEEAERIFRRLCGPDASFMPDNSLREYERTEWGWWDGEWDGRWWRPGDMTTFSSARA